MKFYLGTLWRLAVAITVVFGLTASANAAPFTSENGVSPCAADCLLQHVDDDDDRLSKKGGEPRAKSDDDDDKPQSKLRADESRDDDDGGAKKHR
ncbi:MAG: hypothetical protein H7X92_08760 [Chitinophagales bacterium]|nr:hypothetical protein [Hyphomicrobiales bacterium]